MSTFGHQVGWNGTEPERFWRKVQITGFCWLWIGYKVSRYGHGGFRLAGGQPIAAHRWAYQHLVGPIPEGLTLDHLCRVPACVNPDHLEPVTMRENLRRGYGVVARRTRARLAAADQPEPTPAGA